MRTRMYRKDAAQDISPPNPLVKFMSEPKLESAGKIQGNCVDD